MARPPGKRIGFWKFSIEQSNLTVPVKALTNDQGEVQSFVVDDARYDLHEEHTDLKTLREIVQRKLWQTCRLYWTTLLYGELAYALETADSVWGSPNGDGLASAHLRLGASLRLKLSYIEIAYKRSGERCWRQKPAGPASAGRILEGLPPLGRSDQPGTEQTFHFVLPATRDSLQRLGVVIRDMNGGIQRLETLFASHAEMPATNLTEVTLPPAEALANRAGRRRLPRAPRRRTNSD